MTLPFRPRSRSGSNTATVDLVDVGVHRDPSSPNPSSTDPIADGSFAQRLVHRVSTRLGGSNTSRRSFLTRTAVIGSALAVGPIDFIMKPNSAYGYLCGTCTDGWTAFCCTINNGANACPPGSFVAGWWKADNAAYCCGSARYIIDCNATCPTQCSCRCAGGSCDGRRTCCAQFRYGQCHTEIACYGPVVCRVATCTVPWKYDPSCTTTSRTDNRTVDHGAPCLSKECGTPISQKYDALGGARGFLGRVTATEREIRDGRGRFASYQGGNIYWTATTGAYEVHGGLLTEYRRAGGVEAVGYPIADTRTSGNGRWRYTNLERGRLYYDRRGTGTFTIVGPFFTKHEQLQGIYGFLGYPVANVRRSGDNRSDYQNFSTGRIYSVDGRVVEIHGGVYALHEAYGGVHGTYGYPLGDLDLVGDGIGKVQQFEGGRIWYSPRTNARGLYGKVLDRYLANGGPGGHLGYPRSSARPVGDGIGTWATFERGHIYGTNALGAFQVHGSMVTYYLSRGGPTGALGYPTSDLDPPGTVGGRFQTFQNGTLQYHGYGTVTETP
ncbi:MAG: twin-arginine translocation signal domain-containing protein [Aquihabitans sp.]